MQFINPYSLLGVSTNDKEDIRIAKRKLAAQFEFSNDQTIIWKEITISKNDFDHAINQLDDENKAQYYWKLKRDTALNNFLMFGDESFFINYEHKRIYDNEDFRSFVSPFFAYQYKQLFAKAFQKTTISLLRKVIATSLLVLSHDLEKAYIGVEKLLQEKQQSLNKMILQINKKTGEWDQYNVSKIITWVKKNIDAQMLNMLPDYFQKSINDMGLLLRSLSVVIYNNLDNADIANELIQYALTFNLSASTKQELNKAYNQLENVKKNEQLLPFKQIILQLEALLDHLKQYNKNNNNTQDLVIRLSRGLNNGDNQVINIEKCFELITSLVKPQEINALPEFIQKEIANPIASLLVDIAVELFNLKISNHFGCPELNPNFNWNEIYRLEKEGKRTCSNIIYIANQINFKDSILLEKIKKHQPEIEKEKRLQEIKKQEQKLAEEKATEEGSYILIVVVVFIVIGISTWVGIANDSIGAAIGTFIGIIFFLFTIFSKI